MYNAFLKDHSYYGVLIAEYFFLLLLYTFLLLLCSLDVEGAELPILQSIPFEKVDIKVLDIEIKHAGTIFPGSHEDITNLMLVKGYELYGYIGDGIDAIYVKNGYLDELNEL